jgi:hypothetical protein
MLSSDADDCAPMARTATSIRMTPRRFLNPILLCTFIAIVTGPLFVSAQDIKGEFNCADVQAGLRQWASEIKGINVKLSYVERAGSTKDIDKWTQEVPLISSEVEAFIQSPKIYFTRKRIYRNDPMPVEEFIAWNGSKNTEMAHDPNQPGRMEGSIATQPGSLIRAAYWQSLFGVRVFDLASPLAEVVNRSQNSSLGSKVINGHVAWGVRFNDICRYDVWVDPLCGFAPIEISQTLIANDGKIVASARMFDVELLKLKSVWLPRRATILLDTYTRGQSELITVQAKDIEAGLDIPDEKFVIKFPHRTTVWDDITKLSYIVGEGVYVHGANGLVYLSKNIDPSSADFDATIAALTREQSDLKLPAASAGTTVTQPPTSRDVGWKYPLLFASCILIVILLIWWRLRHARG